MKLENPLPRRVEEHRALAPFTWIKIGGPARYFLRAASAEEISSAIAWAGSSSIPWVVLGGGANVLIADEGFKGLVVRIEDRSLAVDGASVRVGAGYAVTKLAAFAAEKGLSGLEFAMGIPGTVGGAVRGNAGAFDGEMKDVVKSVTVLAAGGGVQERPAASLDFRYRHSCFKEKEEVILAATLQLKPGETNAIREVLRQRLAYRREHQPLEYPSLGSVFKNVPIEKFRNEDLRRSGLESRVSPKRLIPAGLLIELLGLKGRRIGGAQISEKHGNFIINRGGARANDAMGLMQLVETEASVRFAGLLLEKEIQLVGVDGF